MKHTLIACLLLITACTPTASLQPPEECPLPMEYAIRSSCPFTTTKIDGQCVVICPEHNPSAAKPTDSWTVLCTEDSECSCRYQGGDLIRCGCVNNVCAAIVNASLQ